MEGTIVKNGKYVKLSSGETYPISKYQKNHGLSEGQNVVLKIDTEYPESCDSNPFCEGDETCIICLCNNKVGILEL
jgi:hypothetical protein